VRGGESAVSLSLSNAAGVYEGNRRESENPLPQEATQLPIGEGRPENLFQWLHLRLADTRVRRVAVLAPLPSVYLPCLPPFYNPSHLPTNFPTSLCFPGSCIRRLTPHPVFAWLQFGLPTEWVLRLVKLDPERRQVLRVRSCTANSHAQQVRLGRASG
jgi:hypothetical protein